MLANLLVKHYGSPQWSEEQNRAFWEEDDVVYHGIKPLMNFIDANWQDLSLEDVKRAKSALKNNAATRQLYRHVVKGFRPIELVELGLIAPLAEVGAPSSNSFEANPIRRFFIEFKQAETKADAAQNFVALKELLQLSSPSAIATLAPYASIALRYVHAEDVYDIAAAYSVIIDAETSTNRFSVRSSSLQAFRENVFLSDDEKQRLLLMTS